MSREILFKAKRKDWRELPKVQWWVEGEVIHEPYGVVIQYYAEKKRIKVVIDPETLCQYTGLKDKNGKRIWENDIVKINNSKGNVLITFGDFEIICTIPNEKYYKHRLEYDTEYEVIGNIFDNAELLESEE